MENTPLKDIGKVWKKSDFQHDLVVTQAHQKAVARICEMLTSKSRRSALIIGNQGVGKSCLIQMIARSLKERGWYVFSSSASEIMSGQKYIGEIDERVKSMTDKMSSKPRRLWIIPSFHELYYLGRHNLSPVGILDLLLPHMISGKVIILGEIQTLQFEKISRLRPGLRSNLDLIRIEEADAESAVELARQWADLPQNNPIWHHTSKEVIAQANAMVSQYLSDKEEPGNTMDFLRATGRATSTQHNVSKGVQITDLIKTLSAVTGLPSNILDEREPMDIDSLRSFFMNRVMGQDEAIQILVERIAMIKAGLTSPGRPEGVFLFVGPTGTGKTEIAKSLAAWLFGSPERLIRLDMSEFQTADSLLRITGSQEVTNETISLTDQIRKQPFSVILLDEFEKAHFNIWDLFLQVFDDGRLTDANGDTASFRHCIIIMTSNLGAKQLNRTSIGYHPGLISPASSGIEKSLNLTFRPEFINRIDRIVEFNPLSRSVVRRILKKELEGVLQLRGFRHRGWSVEWEDSALDFLLEKGFNSQLGARPMKRAIERYLLAPLAMTIASHQFPSGDQFLFVRRSGNRIKVDFVDPEQPKVNWTSAREKIKTQKVKATSLSLKQIALEAKGTLAEREALLREYDVLMQGYKSDQWGELKRASLEKMAEPGFWDSEDRFSTLFQIEFRDRFEAATETTTSLLDRLRDHNKPRLSFAPDLIRRVAGRLYLLQTAFGAFETEQPQDAWLRLRAEAGNVEFALELKKMYLGWVGLRKMNADVLFESKAQDYELILSVCGFGAWSILEAEKGLHVLEFPQKSKTGRHRVHVDIAAQPIVVIQKEELIKEARQALNNPDAKSRNILRRYRQKPSPLVRDSLRGWRSGRLDLVLKGNFDLIE